MEAGHVFVKNVRDVMVVNRRMARLMNVEVYLRCNETFQVIETIGPRPGIPPRCYGVVRQNRRCDCRMFQTLRYPMHMSCQLVLKSHSMLNNLLIRCTPSSARCMSRRMSSPSYLTCLHRRCL
ncbi:hypothetical protein J1N35_040941 [Gossypium stocksii]|uniref:Uncharacterized protein n=1 Tax=Gossypium stocksii TaxID=47602 RepID=A0A9D3UF23_9ROSI|nr:hypothetical protein J1N35_040941 [Gossypium stocksii]